MTEEHKRKIGEANKITCTPEIRKRYSKMYKGKKRINFSGKNHPMYGKHHSALTIQKIINANINKWKNGIPAYSTKHDRIRKENGKASRCQNRECAILEFKCRKNSNTFHWALIKDREYTMDVNDYLQLCASCHKRYDYKK